MMALERVLIPFSIFLLALGDISTTNGDTITERTYNGPGEGSYSKYPQWLASIKGLCEFSFKTSELDGVLLYMDSSGENGLSSGHYLYVSLDNGAIHVDITVGEIAAGNTTRLQASFGDHLNDNQLHSIRILHDNKQFEFALDGSIMSVLPYNPQFTLETTSKVFIGGIPNNGEQIDQLDVRDSPNFIGCVKNIEFVNSSASTFDLRYKAPISEMNVLIGCMDPCENKQCNGGECIPRWLNEDASFCDCRGAPQAGPNCVEDRSDHQLMLTGTDYSCYSLPPDQPYTGEPQTALLQLIQPIPPDGTIITGISTTDRSSFAIYLENNYLVMELRYQTTTVSKTSANPLSGSPDYRLAYLQQSNYAQLQVHRVVVGDAVLLHENMSLVLPWDIEFDFREICIGGSLLEVVNYAGTLEHVYFRHYALAEERNFEALRQTSEPRLNVIRFLDSPSDRSLVFTKHNFGGRRLQFEIRSGPELGGVLLQSYSEASHSEFGLIPFNGEILVIITHTTFTINTCGEYIDNEWNLIEIESVYDDTDKFLGVNISVNNIVACQLSNATYQPLMAPFATTPIELGRTTGSSGFPLSDPKPFIGCIQNIIFEEDAGSFRPNLEELARTEQRFETTGCFECTENTMISCENGGLCALRGYNDGGCDCPAEYTGDTCEVFVQSTPAISTATTTYVSTCTHNVMCTPTPRPRTEGDDEDIDAAEIGKWVGIGIGGLIGILLLICVFTLLYLIYMRTHSKERGYYTTGETGNKEALPHYSASLRRVSTHTVGVSGEQSNGGVVTDQNRDKEFFI